MKKNLQQRPPIVAVLGHVDHGKTTILDAIRKTNIAAKEAGGITQSIGAWQIETKDKKRITFIDTPGHEAFAKMRSRGAQVADIVVLVVAADDGVMPQTRESLGYIKEANVPFLVAITKTDLATAQPEKVKTQLAEVGVLLEGQGGDVVAVEVAAPQGKGIGELLEMLGLLAEMNEISADPQAALEAPVIETLLDRRRGPVVHAVVRNGTLRVGQEIAANGTAARVRGLFDARQKPIKEALPGAPVEVLGFASLPAVGSVLRPSGLPAQAPLPGRIGPQKIEGFPILLKADTAGSLEAITAQLESKVGFLQKAVGDISESDVMQASTLAAPLVGFNVKVSKQVLKLAEEEGVNIHLYKIIYELLGDVDRWIRESQEAGREKILGRAQIVAEFPHDKKRIAGCRVVEGRITKSDKLRLIRDGEVLGNIYPKSLKKAKEEVSKVEQGEEFGIFFEPQFDFKVGDMIESFAAPK